MFWILAIWQFNITLKFAGNPNYHCQRRATRQSWRRWRCWSWRIWFEWYWRWYFHWRWFSWWRFPWWWIWKWWIQIWRFVRCLGQQPTISYRIATHILKSQRQSKRRFLLQRPIRWCSICVFVCSLIKQQQPQQSIKAIFSCLQQ